MDANKADFPSRFMAERPEVSTSGFHDRRARPCDPAARTIADAALSVLIIEIQDRSRGTYGSPRVWTDLRLGLGIRVGRERVERLMRHADLAGMTGMSDRIV
ncbi:MAG: transposase [Acidimicrobiia bacterium]|nr:MAG: transposase [Acidimicrobiia bacterium]